MKSICFYGTLLWLSLILVSCEAATADGGGAGPPGNPIGVYEIVSYVRFQTPPSGNCCQEDLISDCDLISTFEFKSNGTITYNDFGAYSNCSDSDAITGTYINEAFCCGSIGGDFQLNELFRGEIIYDAFFSGGDPVGDLAIRFNTVSEGIRYSHYMSLIKIN